VLTRLQLAIGAKALLIRFVGAEHLFRGLILALQDRDELALALARRLLVVDEETMEHGPHVGRVRSPPIGLRSDPLRSICRPMLWGDR
jgi:hypothetical protein